MIISEKQIMQLMWIAKEYAHELENQAKKGELTHYGLDRKDEINLLIKSVSSQQSKELKVIE